MKNALIIGLVLAVLVLGFFVFAQDDSTDTANTAKDSNTQQKVSSDEKTINISSQGLNEVPKNILDNRSITTFDVSGNQLTGALPGEIRMLTNLEVLNASDNQLTGIPAEIGQLSNLRVANFANNDITGLPLEIGNLKYLETLDLSGNPNVSQYDISQIQSKIPNANIITD